MAITDEMICLGRDDSGTTATLRPNGLVGGHSHQVSPVDGAGDAHEAIFSSIHVYLMNNWFSSLAGHCLVADNRENMILGVADSGWALAGQLGTNVCPLLP